MAQGASSQELTFTAVCRYGIGWSWRSPAGLVCSEIRGLGRGENGDMKVFSTSFTLSSEERTEVSDITKLVRDALQQSPITAGIALVNTLHTTCALFINEFQSALIDDLKALIERLVPERHGYRTRTCARRSSGAASRSVSPTAS